MNPSQKHPRSRRLLVAATAVILAMLGLGAASASAHSFSATGECGTAALQWSSFAGSGSKPTNRPVWQITREPANTSVASGQATFTGSSFGMDVAIPSTNGSYTATSSWTSANTRDGHSGSGRSTFRLKSCDAITTKASPGVVLGGKISDTAQLAGVTADADGSIEFELFADGDKACLTPLTSSTTPVSGPGEYRSAEFTPTTAGGYQWTATYSGDGKNDPVGPHGCGVQDERVTVTQPPPPPPVKNQPAISTVASHGIQVGKSIHDTASLTGGTDDISGTIRFELFRDADADCERPIFASSVQVDGNGPYVSGSTRPPKAGGYQWTATYSGDVSNETVGPEGCDDPSEHVVVRKKPGSGVKSVCRIANGRLRLSGPSGNVRSPFRLLIHTRGYTRITTFVDGRIVDTVRKGTLRKRTFAVRINPGKMSPGVHRVRVAAASGPKRCLGISRGLNFVRARGSGTTPTFTG